MMRALRRRVRRLLQPRRAALADLRAIFDEPWYAARYPDLRASPGDLFQHFLLRGIAEGHRPNRFFDPAWYEQQHPSAAGRPALVHYALKGRAAKLDPGPHFSVMAYHNRHRDVALAGMDALEHYLKFGRNEGRQIFRSRLGRARDASAPEDPSLLVALDLPLGIEETATRLATLFHLRGTSVGPEE